VFAHGGTGDECAAVLVEPALANHFRVVHYHYFREMYETVRTWLPHAEHAELADANHCILQTNPKGARRNARSASSRATDGQSLTDQGR
jgi:hypothetical protein